jgi:hypothetical protein
MTGNRKGGGTHVLYDPTHSERGALLPVARAPRAASDLDFAAPMIIRNPHALPMFREDRIDRKRQRDPQKVVRAGGLGGWGCALTGRRCTLRGAGSRGLAARGAPRPPRCGLLATIVPR